MSDKKHEFKYFPSFYRSTFAVYNMYVELIWIYTVKVTAEPSFLQINVHSVERVTFL